MLIIVIAKAMHQIRKILQHRQPIVVAIMDFTTSGPTPQHASLSLTVPILVSLKITSGIIISYSGIVWEWSPPILYVDILLAGGGLTSCNTSCKCYEIILYFFSGISSSINFIDLNQIFLLGMALSIWLLIFMYRFRNKLIRASRIISNY